MFTKFLCLTIAWLLTLLAIIIFPANTSFAGQSIYVGNQRFIPLPPPSRVQSRTQISASEAKFMPLDPSRMPAMRLAAKPTIDSVQPKDIPPRPAGAKNSTLTNISPEQAQQLLSIYNQNK